MRDPYEVLEVRKTASKDEIKKAYRELVKKYHPDQYGNNPLRDLAEDKLKELNEAYDYLMSNAPESSQYNSYGNSSQNSYNSNSYQTIEMDIRNGNLGRAEDELRKVTTRDAEWNYLMGLLSLRKGWHNEAYNYLNLACRLSPNNFKYRDEFNRLNNMNSSYREPYYNNRGKDRGLCDICATLYCLDCCCECGGGDFIDCC
ncbi:DnaJ domain-containing protein [Clostridium sp. A1-XYC3]|uniref:DnaJ domain-containing protein n=1 Tax=Clostridium tanneri TaxID=3037988 RepID=A0ABU4JRI2_9CLOT|nr:DnaJ domain-containing protein [Clostridium sp. A1-XYC3]MDW8800701.1 DnaJ domain-containing protein [Clostridium sp. A1-XYC3]